MMVYGDSVAMYSLVPPVSGVIIRNDKIAGSLRAVFHLLWRRVGGLSGNEAKSGPI